MEMCRVCLSIEKDMIPLDESFINNYNLLTNLSVTMIDGMPQYSCQTCLDTVKSFIEFRERSITSEATLREIISSKVKADNVTDNETENESNANIENDNVTDNETEDENKANIEDDNVILPIKSEIKEEIYDSTSDKYDFTFAELDDDLSYLLVRKSNKETKPKRIRRYKKKNKISTAKLIENITDEIENKWFCGICPKLFEDKTDLNNHLDIHKNDRQCNLCGNHVNSLSQLFAHRLVHLPMKQNKCHICERRYRSSVYLEYHYKKVHIEEENTKLSCNICGLEYSSPKRLNSHILYVHSARKFVCDMCSKSFRNKSNLKSHIKLHNEEKAYVCNLCEFSCKFSGGLKDHKIRKHAPEKVYCKNCKRPFLNQEDHDKHKCAQKLVICPICGLQIARNARLSRHMVIHSDIRRYECNRCPAKYKTKAALMAHIDRHDGNRTKQCEYCPARFYTVPVLIKHRRTHTGEKPYVCKICNKGFTGKYNLKVHMKVHGQCLVIKKNNEPEDLTSVFG